MPDYISLRAYARRREVSLSAVQKAIESRRVTAIREEGGRITGVDPIEADKQWAANTDPVEAARNGKFLQPSPGPSAPAPSAASEKPQTEEPAGNQDDFLNARVKEAQLRGELLELDKLERLEELLPRSVVQEEFGEIFTQLKAALSRIPDRKAQVLAAESDPMRVNRILSDEIRTVLDDFARRLAEPAGVAEDAGVAAQREPVLS